MESGDPEARVEMGGLVNGVSVGVGASLVERVSRYSCSWLPGSRWKWAIP